MDSDTGRVRDMESARHWLQNSKAAVRVAKLAGFGIAIAGVMGAGAALAAPGETVHAWTGTETICSKKDSKAFERRKPKCVSAIQHALTAGSLCAGSTYTLTFTTMVVGPGGGPSCGGDSPGKNPHDCDQTLEAWLRCGAVTTYLGAADDWNKCGKGAMSGSAGPFAFTAGAGCHIIFAHGAEDGCATPAPIKLRSVTITQEGAPADLCNGIDDDCDGAVDEDHEPTQTTCGTGACEVTGSTECIDGEVVDTCSAPAPPPPPTCEAPLPCNRVLFSLSHGEATYSNPFEYGTEHSWGPAADLLSASGYDWAAHTAGPLDGGALEGSDVLIIAEPLQGFSSAEVQAIQDFVAAGGGLLLITDFNATIINQVSTGFGVSFLGSNIGWVRISAWLTGLHPVTAGIGNVFWALGSTLSVLDEEVVVLGWHQDQPVYAVREVGDGRVVFSADNEVFARYGLEGIGDPTPGQPRDNEALWLNTVAWLANCQEPEPCEPVSPEAVCNGVDDDCDGVIDEDCTCLQGQVILSDEETLANGAPAVATWDQHSYWTASIPGATWIWTEYFVSQPQVSTTVIFTRSIEIPAGASGIEASIIVSADNSYELSVNGEAAGQSAIETNYFGTKTHDLTGFLVPGENTLMVTVHNWAQPGGNATSNPAGLLYKTEIVYDAPSDQGVCLD
ncbi:MAG: hypothetical protein AMXMBFR64_06610 [Myxococcales bacterium]